MTNKKNCYEHIIKDVEKGSIAFLLGIEPQDVLLAINNNKIIDFIDYSFFSSNDTIDMLIRKKNGETVEYAFEKDEDEPIGLKFENEFMDRQRPCKNKCVFCFIDQMPRHMRKTLYFKDDDWRLSLLMGNYVTFTNVDDAELKRIVERKVSPLYISVHATDKEIRERMLGRSGCDIMTVLKRLAEGGITFNCQIVLCPGLNDGKTLEKTLEDLYSLGEFCKSVAVVPVGITKFREKLYPLNKVDFKIANETLDIIDKFRQKALSERGTRLVFASDEIYITANRSFPSFDEYEDFDQIEDGIGMYAMFSHDFMQACKGIGENKTDAGVICGTLIAPYMQKLLDIMPNKGVKAVAVENSFFGNTINVTGLLTGRDILNHIKEKGAPKHIYIPKDCLRRNEEVFLDDMTLDEFKEKLPEFKVYVVSGGFELVEKLAK